MAKQESILKLRGSIGDLSFTKHRTRGYEVRAKSGVSKERILTDPIFQRTRENMSEFGRAARKSKQIRQQLNILTKGTADATMRNRLVSLIHRIQKRDVDNPRGKRMFQRENASQLRGFEFNQHSNLSLLFAQALVTQLDRDAGILTLSIPPFDPQTNVSLLQGATHMRFILAAAPLPDTDELLPRPLMAATAFIPLIGQYTGTELEVRLPADLPNVVYALVGISVYQQVHADYYPLNDGLHNALTIVQVDVSRE